MGIAVPVVPGKAILKVGVGKGGFYMVVDRTRWIISKLA